jgi:tetrapyrrole methylase family protein/MazG family protein
VFHSELGRESGYFNLLDITDGICKKLTFRHPHVFSDLEIDEKDLPEMWERLKQIEKNNKNTDK